MDKKELVKLYIDTHEIVKRKEENLNSAFQEIGSENWVVNIVPNEYCHLVDTLILQYINHVELDWVGWWMYEECRGVSDSTGVMDLENLDEFYDFAFLNKTVAEIMENRNDKTSRIWV